MDIDPEVQAARERIERTLVPAWYDDGASRRKLIERLADLEVGAALAVRGFRRWKRYQGVRGGRYEAEHGLEDLGQGVSDLDALLHKRYTYAEVLYRAPLELWDKWENGRIDDQKFIDASEVIGPYTNEDVTHLGNMQGALYIEIEGR